ncbi:MAG: type II toxin-antitoxin system RelE/ParE family toxin [Chloroflexi bacterium]|nr:type II toxin-antitoxin system RelE/ParE family toxin [Chloroflexota bacterium]
MKNCVANLVCDVADRLDPLGIERYAEAGSAGHVESREAVVRLADIGQGDVTKLVGPDDQWRLRVGDWRVRFLYDYQSTTIRVIRVLPRGRAYRD